MEQKGAPPTEKMGGRQPFVEPEYDCSEQCCLCGSRCQLGICLLLCPCCAVSNFETIQDYERGVVLRLGRQTTEMPISGGMHLVLPGVDELMRVDIREKIIDIPAQQVTTKDGLNIHVDGVVFYKIFDAAAALLGVKNLHSSISNLAQTQLRTVLAKLTYDQIQLDRGRFAILLQDYLDEATDPWGVDITRVELQDVRLPANIAKSLAGQEEAKLMQLAVQIQTKTRTDQETGMERNRAQIHLIKTTADSEARNIQDEANAKARMIVADGEKRAAAASKNAADILSKSPVALQLRYLDTLEKIGCAGSACIMVPAGAGGAGGMQAITNRLLENRMTGKNV